MNSKFRWNNGNVTVAIWWLVGRIIQESLVLPESDGVFGSIVRLIFFCYRVPRVTNDFTACTAST